MGNFKPPAKIMIGGKEKIMVFENIDILEMLIDGYWVEQNIPSPRAIWLRHATEYLRPNISWNTLMHLQEKKFIKEHGTLHPVARFTITAKGEKEYARLVKQADEDKRMADENIDNVIGEMPPTGDGVPLVAEPRKEFLIPVVTPSPSMVALHYPGDHGATLILTFPNVEEYQQVCKKLSITPIEPSSKKPRGEGVMADCSYCKEQFPLKFTKEAWKRYCKKRECINKYASDRLLFIKIYNRSPKPGDHS